jgi:hypothetical protein
MFRKSDYFLWKWGFRSEHFSTSSAIILIIALLFLKWHHYQETRTIIVNPAQLSIKAMQFFISQVVSQMNLCQTLIYFLFYKSDGIK